MTTDDKFTVHETDLDDDAREGVKHMQGGRAVEFGARVATAMGNIRDADSAAECFADIMQVVDEAFMHGADTFRRGLIEALTVGDDDGD